MKKILYLFFLLVLFSPSLFAQIPNSVSGYVYDKSSGKAITDVNVFIANTIYGTVTDEKGYYEIRSLPKGTLELIVAIVGYESQSKLIFLKRTTNLKIDFKLKPVIYEADAISVEAENPDEWIKNLQKFKVLFLGKSPWASKCIIENEEVLDFLDDKYTKMFTAHAIAPLKITNYGLGFSMECVLDNFYWDRQNGKWGWAVKPKFTIMTPRDSEQSAVWRENRKKAYYGSRHHFLITLINNELQEEGFLIHLTKNAGRAKINDPFSQMSVIRDSVLTRGYVTGQYILKFDNFLKITYNSEYNYNQINIIDALHSYPAYQESWIRLKYDEVTIDSFGYVDQYLPFEVAGFWADRGVADLLPRYFDVK